MTIGELLVIYERNYVAFLKNRLGTSRRLHTYVGQLANIPLADLTKMQVLEWFHAIGQAKGGHAANQALQQLHSMYVQADEWELFTGKNPAHRIKKFPKHSRERFLQANELPWLLKSLADERPTVETYFLTLLLTGARRDEARTMQWTHLDLDRALWHKPTTKTGVPHTIPLPPPGATRDAATRLAARLRVGLLLDPMQQERHAGGFVECDGRRTRVAKDPPPGGLNGRADS